MKKIVSFVVCLIVMLQAACLVPPGAFAESVDLVQTVSLGYNHSAAIKTDGSLWLWGDNEYGKIGNGIAGYYTTPVKITGNAALPESTSAKVEEAKEVKVTLPSFKININGEQIDNAYAKYPYIVFNDITYFPMTYNGARFLGLQTEWDQTNGLRITKLDGIQSANENTKHDTKNSISYNAGTATGKITVNGKSIDNASEPHPLLIFRDVTYFPLTWKFAVDEFGWDYSFIAESGLVINSK